MHSVAIANDVSGLAWWLKRSLCLWGDSRVLIYLLFGGKTVCLSLVWCSCASFARSCLLADVSIGLKLGRPVLNCSHLVTPNILFYSAAYCVKCISEDSWGYGSWSDIFWLWRGPACPGSFLESTIPQSSRISWSFVGGVDASLVAAWMLVSMIICRCILYEEANENHCIVAPGAC